MRRAQLNQKEAADELGIDNTFLNHLLKGRRSPGLQTAHKIEDRTGIATESWLPISEAITAGTNSKTGRKR